MLKIVATVVLFVLGVSAIGLAALIGVHLSTAAYVARVVWLLTEWSAGTLPGAEAGVRWSFLAEQGMWSLAAALGLGIALYLLDRLLLTRWLGPGSRRWAAGLAASSGALVVAAGLVAGLVALL
jgi:hypothetical protein